MGLNEEVEEFCCEDGGNEYEIRKVDALQAMGALVTKEAGSMSPMKFRMSKADKAPWVDMKFFRNKGTAEGRRHQRFREVVQMYDLHSCEGWSGNKEMVDALHGWASMNLDMSSRSVAERGMVQGKPNQKKRDKDLSTEVERTLEYLVLKFFWNYVEKMFDKSDIGRERMMRNILTHANVKWREQNPTKLR